jgi:hypothetical protein
VRKTLTPATRVEPKVDACAEPASKVCEEELRVAWFATAGTLEIAQTGASESGLSSDNLWIAPTKPQGVSLWIVLRDERGGVDWRELRFDVVK